MNIDRSMIKRWDYGNNPRCFVPLRLQNIALRLFWEICGRIREKWTDLWSETRLLPEMQEDGMYRHQERTELQIMRGRCHAVWQEQESVRGRHVRSMEQTDDWASLSFMSAIHDDVRLKWDVGLIDEGEGKMTDHETTTRKPSEKDRELLNAVVERYLEKTVPILIENFEPFKLEEKDALESIARLAEWRHKQLWSSDQWTVPNLAYRSLILLS